MNIRQFFKSKTSKSKVKETKKPSKLGFYVMESLRYFAHAILIAVSVVLSIHLFTQFVQNPLEKIIFGVIAFALESVKLWVFIRGKRELFGGYFHVTKAELAVKRGAGVVKMSLYLILATISIIASIGFALSTLERQTFVAQLTNSPITTFADDIKTIDNSIAVYNKKIEALDPTWVSSTIKFTDAVADLRDEKLAIETKRDIFKEQDQITASMDVFSSLAEKITKVSGGKISVNGKDFMFWLMVLITFLIEICAVITAPKEKDDIKEGVIKDVTNSIPTEEINTKSTEKVSIASRLSEEDILRIKASMTRPVSAPKTTEVLGQDEIDELLNIISIGDPKEDSKNIVLKETLDLVKSHEDSSLSMEEIESLIDDTAEETLEVDEEFTLNEAQSLTLANNVRDLNRELDELEVELANESLELTEKNFDEIIEDLHIPEETIEQAISTGKPVEIEEVQTEPVNDHIESDDNEHVLALGDEAVEQEPVQLEDLVTEEQLDYIDKVMDGTIPEPEPEPEPKIGFTLKAIHAPIVKSKSKAKVGVPTLKKRVNKANEAMVSENTNKTLQSKKPVVSDFFKQISPKKTIAYNRPNYKKDTEIRQVVGSVKKSE